MKKSRMEGSTIKFKAFPKSVGPISDDAIRHWTKVLTKGGYVTRLRKSWLRSERVIGTKRRIQLWQDRIKQIRIKVWGDFGTGKGMEALSSKVLKHNSSPIFNTTRVNFFRHIM